MIRNNTSGDQYVYIDHSIEYVSWRFRENPVCKYELLEVVKDGNCIACLAVNITEKERAIITDFIFDQNADADHINSSVLNYLIRKGYAEAECYGNCLNPGISSILSSLKKFKSKSFISPYLGFIFNNVQNKNINPEEWYLTGAWTEGFKI
jgi:hypothetical protein